MSLFGPNSQTALIDDDDDSGASYNARIRAELGEGTYFVRVSHYFPDRTGEYRIEVRAI
jgi:tyrosinase